jgi:hypothetical protein
VSSSDVLVACRPTVQLNDARRKPGRLYPASSERDNAEVVSADEIRELMLEPARETMV